MQEPHNLIPTEVEQQVDTMTRRITLVLFESRQEHNQSTLISITVRLDEWQTSTKVARCVSAILTTDPEEVHCLEGAEELSVLHTPQK